MTLKNSNIAGGLVKAINNVENPKKTEATDEWGNNFSYAPLDEVVKVIKRALAEENMAVLQPPAQVSYQVLQNGFEQGVATVTTQIVHESGEVLEFDPITFKANGNTPQMVGSAITYGRRYSLMSIFGIAGEDDDDGRVASLHGVNTGSSKSVPENPNNETKSDKEEVSNNNEAVDLINDEQRQELMDLATNFAEMRDVAVEGVIGAFGGLEDLTASKFEPTKSKLIGWINKAKAENEKEVVKDEVEEKATEVKNAKKENEEKVDKEKDSKQSKSEQENNGKGVTKGSAVFIVSDIEQKQTKEGTEYFEVQVQNAKTPMFAKPDVVKDLKVGLEFLGFFTKNGNKVTLERVEDVENVQTSLV